ncbi:dihydrofolate synthase [Gemmatimonadetes bacterium T265]|nr:dihydrofolate synthase [Gemmatimonadetes bacterium T265]
MLAELGDPHRAYPVFHVAGTNGKGSTVAILTALLRARGLTVGTYTSPHLVDFRERVVVDGRAIAPEAVLAFLGRVDDVSRVLGATFFEVTTALAFDHFARARVGVAVIETGLGGRLDATNVVDPVVAGVTEIGLDHTELLGSTIPEIAREKAGIYKPGRAAVVGAWDAVARETLVAHARAVGASPVRVVADEFEISHVAVAPGGTRFRLASAEGARSLNVGLAGAFQPRNVATALAMLDAAGPRYAAAARDVNAVLGHVRLAGRAQRHGRWLFDVAHNPDGARALRGTLEALSAADDAPRRPITALVGVLADKDWRGVLDALAPAVDAFVLTTPPTAPAGRVWDLSAVAAHAAARGYVAAVEPDFDAALASVDARAGTAVVTGSFHTVGDAMARLQVDPLGG